MSSNFSVSTRLVDESITTTEVAVLLCWAPPLPATAAAPAPAVDATTAAAPAGAAAAIFFLTRAISTRQQTSQQGLTLVHLSAQRKRFLWYRGCFEGLFRGFKGFLGGV